MANREFIECDENCDEVKKQIKELESKGFVVTNQVDWTMIFESTNESDRDLVIAKHRSHIDNLNKARSILGRPLAKYTV